MKHLEYQEKAIKRLVEETIDLLSLSRTRSKLIFKAPTGSGKTVMAMQMLSRLKEELASRGDMPFREVAVIWIAPNKLHVQSYEKMKCYFEETRVLRPATLDELDHAEGYIKPGEVLFVNWESINRDSNVAMRESESGLPLYEIVRRTREVQGVPIVAVIDEEHLFWSNTADKSAAVLERINPDVEVRISATPKTQSDNIVKVRREEVVREQMIKRQVVLNPDIDEGYNGHEELNIHLLRTALRQREMLKDAYREANSKVNPLLLIQLPNDKSESLSAEESKIADQVKDYLELSCNISTENKRLAVWLSSEKKNLEGLEQADCMTEVLLFKQAIALGWDCPRAAVLLIFRKLQSETFTIQTVGRILRMPEQHFYDNDLLNVGYVYTNLSREQIEIVAEDANYLNKQALKAVRREEMENVRLHSYYRVYKSSDRNRLGPDFKGVLAKTLVEEWGLHQVGDLLPEGEAVAKRNREIAGSWIKFDVASIGIEIPSNLVFQNEVQTIDVQQTSRFARTTTELGRVYIDFCRAMLREYEKTHSTDVLAGYLCEVMFELFDLDELEAEKVILYHKNKHRFTAVIDFALEKYKSVLQEKRNEAKMRAFEQYEWEVPAERLYEESTHHICKDVDEHALLPFVERNDASKPEQRFAAFLESNSMYIDWWYKNGDEGRQHYAVPYTNCRGEKVLFYVDFVIRMKNGQVFLLDTKAANSDNEAANKHNALQQYMQAPERKELHLKGGVIIEQNGVWYFCDGEIVDTSSVEGWTPFFPDQYN